MALMNGSPILYTSSGRPLLEVNMGQNDRLIRGALGAVMFLNGVMQPRSNALTRFLSGVGGAFLLYGVTGFDPLLRLFGVSSIPGRNNNVMNKLKKSAPGHGINPILTEQAVPRNHSHTYPHDATVSEALSIS